MYSQFVGSMAGSIVSGTVDATGPLAGFYYPAGVCCDAAGNVYVADQYNHKIRKVSPGGAVTTIAGSGSAGATDATGSLASFNRPYSICMDGAGNFIVGDLLNNKIRKVTPAGNVTTIAGTGATGATNGPALSATFNYPNGVCVDNSGNIYVADYFNHLIRKINSAGTVSTFAGSGLAGAVDATGTSASFNGPSGICIDATGNLYVTDYNNHKIRKITPAGVVTTLAGSGSAGATDGFGSGASFNGPGGAFVNSAGNILISDTYNHKIRMVTPSGSVTTIAGSGIPGSNDGIASLAEFNFPIGICTNTAGTIYIGDIYNHKIRQLGSCIAPTSPVNITSNTNLNVCAGNSTTLTAISYGSQTWFSSATATLPVASGSVFVSSNTLAPGNYTLYAEASTCTTSINRTPILYTINPLPTITVNSGSVCTGNSFVITPSGAFTYTYSSGSATLTVLSNTTILVTGTSTNGCISSNTAISSISALSSPSISISNYTICNGQTVTLSPLGASSYTFSSGAATLSPVSNTQVLVMGASSAGCLSSNQATCNIQVFPNPTVTASGGSICAGGTFNILPSGATSYTISGGSFTVNPSVTSSYTVSGSNSSGCINTAASTVTVFPNPTLSIVANRTLMCIGESNTLSANGATTYTWNTGSANPLVTTPVNTGLQSYTVVGADQNQCAGTSVITIQVDQCTELQPSAKHSPIYVYPNPSNGRFVIVFHGEGSCRLFNSLGQVLDVFQFTAANHFEVSVSNLAAGIYYLAIYNGADPFIQKVMVK